MRIVASAFLVAVFLMGCKRSSVDIQNAANVPVTNVDVQVAGNKLSIDSVAPGESHRVRYSTKAEDTLTVGFIIRGERKKCSDKSYVTTNFQDEFTVRISSDGRCAIFHEPLE